MRLMDGGALNFEDAISAMLAYTIPVLLIVFLGVWIKRSRKTPPGFFPVAEWFAFYIAFPALLFLNTAKLQVHGDELFDLAVATLGPTFLVTLLVVAGLLLAKKIPDPSRSSIVQGAIRPSTYFGLAVSLLLFPPDVAALVMLGLAICLPPINVIAIVALAWWGSGSVSAGRVLKMLAKNPIILATIAGALVNWLHIPFPQALQNTLGILGNASLALGLVCVGGGLEFKFESARPKIVLLTAALKLLFFPMIAVVLCRVLGASDAVTQAACFCAALPAASNAYIMARQMGGDAPLMASQITLQTMLALLTVPLVMNLPSLLPHW